MSNKESEKRDYSATCNLNDEDINNKCWQCARFCFPIGCMVYTDGKGRKLVVKVTEKPEIVVHGTVDKPYFEIKYSEVGKEGYTIGYSSYDLKECFRWLEEEFEVVSDNKVGRKNKK